MKRVFYLIVISLLLALISSTIEPVFTYPTTNAELEVFGDGVAEWTSETAYTGSHSAKLLIPEGASESSWAIVKVPYGDSLESLKGFSFYVKYVAARPRFAVYLDKNRDGNVDSLLLSDYLDFGSGEWITGTGGRRWGWTEATYPPYRYGDVWEPYEYWQKLYGDAAVLYVAAALEYWAAEPEGIGELLYVDAVTINTTISSTTYDLEPTSEVIKPLGVKAAELAIKVIGKSYHTELGNRFTKGWKDGRFVEPEEIEYLDCSGLVYWAYNKAYGATKYSPWDKESYTVNDQKEVKFHNPIAFEGAENQYWYNTEKIDGTDLQPGDLLFFNTPDPGNPDHVAMYVGGPFEFEYAPGKTFIYNTVEATAWGDCIVTVAYYDANSGYLKTLKPSTGDTRSLKVSYYGRVKFPVVIPFGVAKIMGIVTKSPVNLIVTDPEGFTITNELREVSNMIYLESDMDGDNELDNIVLILGRKIGDYFITVAPKPEATPTDTYTLEVLAENIVISFAEGVSVSDIPTKPYILRSTETELIPIIPATIDFDPDVLNIKSKGKWITIYIELPVGHGYSVDMIDVQSVMLNDTVQAQAKPTEIGDHDEDGIPDLMIKFDRKAVQSILKTGEAVKIKIAGRLIDGRLFEGTDVISVTSLP